MKTEEKWLEIYHECCHMFNDKGEMGNRVRLKLGQFTDDDTWACIELICVNKKVLKKIIEVSDKYNLRCDFQGNYEMKLWEEYSQIAEEAKK